MAWRSSALGHHRGVSLGFLLRMPSNARRAIWLRTRLMMMYFEQFQEKREAVSVRIANETQKAIPGKVRSGFPRNLRKKKETVMSIRILSLTVAAMLAATGLAEARPDSRTLSCGQIQAMIQSRRAVVLTTGPNTYDRYVRQYGNECDWPEVPQSAYIPARDGRCPVYRCDQPIWSSLN